MVVETAQFAFARNLNFFQELTEYIWRMVISLDQGSATYGSRARCGSFDGCICKKNVKNMALSAKKWLSQQKRLSTPGLDCKSGIHCKHCIWNSY